MNIGYITNSTLCFIMFAYTLKENVNQKLILVSLIFLLNGFVVRTLDLEGSLTNKNLSNSSEVG